jgi:putative transcriptional regulator
VGKDSSACLFVVLALHRDAERDLNLQETRGGSGRHAEGSSAFALSVDVKNRLHVLRAERDWSQADLAERLGVSRQTVNAVETGRSDPSLALAFRIGHLFGALIEDVFEPEPAAGRRS